jgi:hypothetical protein
VLSDLLALEQYFGSDRACLFLEDAARHYDRAMIAGCLPAGHIVARRIVCGPDCGRVLFTLSDEGRRVATIRAA